MEQIFSNVHVGADYQQGKATFTVWAPEAKSVHLILDESEPISMENLPFGYWTLTREEAKPGDLYWYLLDNDLKRPDPASLAQPSSVHGPSEIIDLHGYQWKDSNWKGIPMAEMIIYELHVGTFTPEGTFAGVAQKLDYLKDLGINTIEIMPVAQFPGTRNWGYDGVHPFAVQHSYGGALGLMQLVDACHQKGIAVLLDVVYNHLGPEGNYLYDFGPYFTDKHHTPWGKAVNVDDAHADAVRGYFHQNALMWLNDFHIDGLRLDAIHAIKDTSARHFLAELSEKVYALGEQNQRTYTLIGECDLNDSRYISPPEVGGYHLTGQWIDEFHHALHAYLTGEDNGYYVDFGDMHHIRKAFEETYVYNGIYSPHRKRTFGNSAEHNPYSQFVVFSQNHDQIGNRMLGDRLTTNVSWETLKLLAGAVLLSPYVPMLFMGEEYAEKKPFQYFVSHTEPELVEAVRQGRKKEFAYFHSEGQEVPDPQSEETFKNSSLSWDTEQQESATMLKFYKALIELRKNHPCLQAHERDATQVLRDGEVLVIARAAQSQQAPGLYCVFNFSEEAQSFSLPLNQNQVQLRLNSNAAEWSGPGDSVEAQPSTDTTAPIPARAVLVYENS